MIPRERILSWLRETDAARLESLWLEADAARRDGVGDQVHLRGLIEISNHCVRRCAYCGIHAGRSGLARYRMTRDEILECARRAVALGYGTVVMQAGEDPGIAGGWMAEVIRAIKGETPLAVTLSLGERTGSELAAWRAAGADRYLLRFETSNPVLFARIHPPAPGVGTCDRIARLREMRALGYEIGSGVMVGIPGQTWEDLAADIETFASLDLDMIGVGPYIPHPETALATKIVETAGAGEVPATDETTYRVIALARLVCPGANIPSTTALATLNRAEGREMGLRRGANVVMPNLTPPQYRPLYEIYPGKACVRETAEDCDGCLRRRIASTGRVVGRGRGDSPRFRQAPRTAARTEVL